MTPPMLQCPACPQRFHTGEALAEHLYAQHSSRGNGREHDCVGSVPGQDGPAPCPSRARFVIENGRQHAPSCDLHLPQIVLQGLGRRSTVYIRRAAP